MEGEDNFRNLNKCLHTFISVKEKAHRYREYGHRQSSETPFYHLEIEFGKNEKFIKCEKQVFFSSLLVRSLAISYKVQMTRKSGTKTIME